MDEAVDDRVADDGVVEDLVFSLAETLSSIDQIDEFIWSLSQLVTKESLKKRLVIFFLHYNDGVVRKRVKERGTVELMEKKGFEDAL